MQELMVTNREDLNAIKSLVTDRDIAIEDKYVRSRGGDNRVNFMFTTNYVDAIRIDRNERRFCPFAQKQKTADDLVRDGLDGAFWSAIHKWAEHNKGFQVIAGYLMEYDIKPELNPALGCSRAPKTSTWENFVEGSATGVQQEIMELMAQGAPGFAGGWISSMALDKFLQNRRLGNVYTHNRRKEMLAEMGYVQHPHLANGRVSTEIPIPDAGKPRLFVPEGSIQYQIVDRAMIKKTYIAAQQLEANGGVPLAPGVAQ